MTIHEPWPNEPDSRRVEAAAEVLFDQGRRYTMKECLYIARDMLRAADRQMPYALGEGEQKTK